MTDPADSRWRSLDKTGNVRLLPDGDEDLAPAASAPPPRPSPQPPLSRAGDCSSRCRPNRPRPELADR